jgi:colanic acid biosynthesis glycosyl transferase WcaI
VNGSPLHAGAAVERRLRILVLHQHYWPETAATAQVLSDLCEDLAGAGHHVHVVCGEPSYRLDASSPPSPAREEHQGVHVERVPAYAPRERTIPKRLLHYGSYFTTSLAAALRGPRPDVCLVMSTPPLLLGVSGTLLRALRGVPFVYSVQDLYPNVAIHLGVIPAQGPLTACIRTVASACYRSAAALVTLSGGMAASLVAAGAAADRVHVIQNWADTAILTPEPRDNPLARDLGIERGFVVQYSGNLGLSQGLATVIEAASLLADKPIHWVIAGDGNARASLIENARARGLRNVTFLPHQPREQLGAWLSACDVGLVTMKRGVGRDLVPSKLYGIMAVGRPVLAAVEPTSEVHRVLQEHNCGWVVEPESAAALADGVLAALRASAHERAAIGARGREACSTLYSRRAATARYERVLRSVAR